MELQSSFQIEIPGFQNRYKSYLVGKEEGKYLIIKSPAIANGQDFFMKNKDLTIRYIYQGSVYGFRSSVIHSLWDNFNVLFIKFPSSIENYNLRSAKRLPCYLPARLEVVTKAKHRKLNFQGTISDLSKGGCRIRINRKELAGISEPLQFKSEILIYLNLPAINDELTLSGEVRNTSQDQEGLALGIKFVELDNKTETRLNKFITANES